MIQGFYAVDFLQKLVNLHVLITIDELIDFLEDLLRVLPELHEESLQHRHRKLSRRHSVCEL